MYENFFNLVSKPFALAPDPQFLFASRQHAAALTMLEFALESQANFAVLTGEIGSGKTTLVRQLIRALGKDIAVGLVANTHQRFNSILPWVLSSLAVPTEGSEVQQYEAFTSFVVRRYAQGGRTLIIVDEAQNLSMDGLEELRLLSNVNSESDIALQTLLIGQPQLRSKLQEPELRQFAQRVGVDFHLESLGLDDAGAYIRHRLSVAGADRELFAEDAIALIHARTGGIPRLINTLCELSLVYAYADGVDGVDAVLVREVLVERERGVRRILPPPDPTSLLAISGEMSVGAVRT